jgi:hypothetical protein
VDLAWACHLWPIIGPVVHLRGVNTNMVNMVYGFVRKTGGVAFSTDKAHRALIWVVLPLVVYTLVAATITWPLARHLSSYVVGAGDDTYMMIRGAWAAHEALLGGHNPLRQTLLAYPEGFTSYVMWSTPLRWLPGALLMVVFPPLLAYNVWLFATLILNGTTAYWLGMELSDGHPLAALLGGLVFMASPAMQGHLRAGHIDVIAMYGLPLFALCLWRILFHGAGWRTAGWGGVWLALSCLGLTSQIIYNAMPVVLFMGLYVLLWERHRLFRPGAPLRDQPWARAAAMIALGGAILLIFFGPLLTSQGRAEVDLLAEPGRVYYSADLLAFVSPSPFGTLKDLLPGYTRDVLGLNWVEGEAYLGVIALALALVALAARRESRGWLALALGAMLFSLGPFLKWRNQLVVFCVEDYQSYVTLPWAAFQNLPVLTETRTPGRFNGATALALGALVSIGARIVLRKIRRREVQIGVVLVLGAVTLVEYQLFWPYEASSAPQSKYFHRLAAMSDVRGVADVPLDNPLAVMEAMYQQTIHGKPMVGGQLYRRTPQNPAVLTLLNQAVTGNSVSLPAVPPEDVPYLLSRLGVDRLILHKYFLSDAEGVVNRMASVLGTPEYEDRQIAAFVVPRTADPPPEFTLATAAGSSGWTEPVDTGTFSGPFLADQGDWSFYAAQPYGELVFRTAPYGTPRRIGVWLDGHLLNAWWALDGEVRLPVWVEPGFHTLHFEALDGCTPYPFALTCLALPGLSGSCAVADSPYCLSVAFEPPQWTPAALPLTPIDVRLDQGLRLRAYTLSTDAATRTVSLRLFWAADHALSRSYALFVHIADPDTNQPLAQYDGLPLILTDDWTGGAEWVSDVTIQVPDDVPAGTYAVNAGWFDPEGGARIRVHGDQPGASDGLIRLGTVTVP